MLRHVLLQIGGWGLAGALAGAGAAVLALFDDLAADGLREERKIVKQIKLKKEK